MFPLLLALSAWLNLARTVRRTAELAVRPGAVCFAVRQQVPLVRPPASSSFAALTPRSNLLRAARAPIGQALAGPWESDPSDFAPFAHRALLRWPLARLEVCWRASIARARLHQRMPAPRQP